MGWWTSLRCRSCGNAAEGDGFETPLPADLRRLILAEEGEWVLEATSQPSLVTLKVIRFELSLSMSELRTLVRRLPGAVSWGTAGEVAKLRDAVLRQDALAPMRVRRLDAASPAAAAARRRGRVE